MIVLDKINKVYRTSDIETAALSDISLEILEGDFLSIMGTSGCGKSTLLNILGLLDHPSSGKYYFDGMDISTYNELQKAELRKRNIGFIFQNFNLIDELSVEENVELPLYYLKVAKAERKERVYEVLDKMGMAHRAKHFPKQLSGGQQQRAAVSRAVITKPKIILADEPTGNLDSHFGREVLDTLCSLNEAGTSIIMVTHSEHDASFSKRIINLYDGKLMAQNEIQPNHF